MKCGWNAVIFNQKLYQNRDSLEMSFEDKFNEVLGPKGSNIKF